MVFSLCENAKKKMELNIMILFRDKDCDRHPVLETKTVIVILY
jgi:hypothetical protein